MENKLLIFFTGYSWTADPKKALFFKDSQAAIACCDFNGIGRGCIDNMNGIYFIAKPATP